jgi:hypothetical protein
VPLSFTSTVPAAGAARIDSASGSPSGLVTSSASGRLNAPAPGARASVRSAATGATLSSSSIRPAANASVSTAPLTLNKLIATVSGNSRTSSPTTGTSIVADVSPGAIVTAPVPLGPRAAESSKSSPRVAVPALKKYSTLTASSLGSDSVSTNGTFTAGPPASPSTTGAGSAPTATAARPSWRS